MGSVLSPYAVTKIALEDYARFSIRFMAFKLSALDISVSLGLDNLRRAVYGSHSSIHGVTEQKEESKIFGDGEQTRDFATLIMLRSEYLGPFTENKDSFGGPSTLRAEKPSQ